MRLDPRTRSKGATESALPPSPGADGARAAGPGDELPRHPRRRLLAGAAAVITAVVVAAVVKPFGSSGDSAADPSAAAGAGARATVEEGSLARRVYETGALGYAARPDGSPFTVVNQAGGSYTTLPSAGEAIGCGEVAYRVDAEPVVLVCGSIPAYRALAEGTSGPDVRVLNGNLVRLGYADEGDLDPASPDFGSATTAALGELQADLGMAETGSLELGDAIVLPGPLRIAGVSATLGTPAQPGQPVAEATSTEREVLVELSATQRAGVEVGDRAQVTLPDNTTTPGEVTRIGAPSTAPSGEGEGSGFGSDSGNEGIPIHVSLERPRDARGLDEASVQVEITTGRVPDALSVPVTALVAQAGGGYAVEVVAADGTRELVAVELGMFDQANGRVEVEGPELSAGQQVVVPAT